MHNFFHITHRFLLAALIVLPGCLHNPPRADVHDILLSLSPPSSFIHQKYHHDHPLAQLINMPVYTYGEMAFELQQDTAVQIYAAGELIYNLADGEPVYFFKGDDMEFFFSIRDKKTNSDIHKVYTYSWADSISHGGRIHFKKQGTEFWGYQFFDAIDSRYIAEIKFPWDTLGYPAPYAGMAIPFDIAIGDNDDDFKQEAKIAWYSKTDLLQTNTRNHGRLVLAKKPGAQDTATTIMPVYQTVTVDGTIDDAWSQAPAYNISNLVAGFVQDRYDLSATIQTCWDKNALYFLVTVQDATRKQIWLERVRQAQTFLDYGWLEDEKGKKIWEMNALDTRHAGGAIKNQQIDTILHLKKGKYKLKYTSDESHAFNNWDDDPPATPFYGIVLYTHH